MTDATRATRFLLPLLLTLPLAAQSPFEPAPARPLPVGETLLSLPSPHVPTQGVWEVKFAHRFNQAANQGNLGDQLHSLFGLDSSAEVMFGVSWTLRPTLQLSLARNNVNDTVELAGKLSWLRESDGRPLTLAVRGGVAVRTEEHVDDRSSAFAQLILARRLGSRTEVYAIPTFVTNAGRAVSGDRSVALFEHAFNVPVAFAVMIGRGLSLVGEVMPPNGDLEGADPGWAIGVKRALGGHWFEILLTNNLSTLTDQAVTSSYQGTPFELGRMHLGFNIERRFGRRR